MNNEQIIAELRERIENKPKKKRNRYKSKLEPHRRMILSLKNSGASLAELQLWLGDRRIKVARSTIKRFIDNA